MFHVLELQDFIKMTDVHSKKIAATICHKLKIVTQSLN